MYINVFDGLEPKLVTCCNVPRFSSSEAVEAALKSARPVRSVLKNLMIGALLTVLGSLKLKIGRVDHRLRSHCRPFAYIYLWCMRASFWPSSKHGPEFHLCHIEDEQAGVIGR